MLIKDEIYLFEIFYCDNKDDSKKMSIYSNNGDLYELEDVPRTTYRITCYYQDLNDNKGWESKDDYIVGDEITLKEAKEEIEALDKYRVYQNDKVYLQSLTLRILKNFCKNKENNIKNADEEKIYLNKNISYNEKIRGRIPVISAEEREKSKIISPKQIVNGRIYKLQQLKFIKRESQNLPDKSYIELE